MKYAEVSERHMNLSICQETYFHCSCVLIVSPVLDNPVHPEHGEVEAGEDEEGGDAGGGQGVQGLVHYQEPGQTLLEGADWLRNILC